jgi:DNA-binding NarL/FixJ family response regulator
VTSVVLVDDQVLVRDGLRLILALAGIEVVGEAGDGAVGAELVMDTRPDVVLMDIRMPGVDGVEATRRIVASKTPTRVLVLTTFDDDALVYAALRAGAAGFLLKDAGRERLVEAVRTTAAGDSPMAPSVVQRLVGHYVSRPPAGVVPEPRIQRLSEREVEVLRLVGVGLSNPEIAERLVVSMATVKTHVRHILAKLGLRDRVQAVVMAHESGLVDRVRGEGTASRPGT